MSDIEEISGHGLTATVDGMKIAIGNDKLMDRLGVPYIPCHSVGTIIHMAVGGNELREAAEGVLNVVQVLEEVQMVGLDVENDRDGGEEAQERVAVFAALGDVSPGPTR